MLVGVWAGVVTWVHLEPAGGIDCDAIYPTCGALGSAVKDGVEVA